MAGESDVVVAGNERLKVFLSYSRADMAAADALVETLERDGFSVTIDRRDLPYGEEWQAELAGFIAASDTVVWLVSPDSVASKWCNWELGEVQRLSKRLVPVKLRDIDPGTLPEALGRIHLLPAEGVYEPARHAADLARALDTDAAWLKQGTILAQRAREWLARDRDTARLLRGAALQEAEDWSRRRPRAAPAPASETLQLILASRQTQDRRRRNTVIGSIAATVVALVLAGAAVWFGLRAEEQAAEAERQRVVAERNEARAVEQEGLALEREAAAVHNESVSLAALSRVALAENRPADAVKLALAAWPRVGDEGRPTLKQSTGALAHSLPLHRERTRLKQNNAWMRAASISQDTTLAVLPTRSGNAGVWDAIRGREIAVLEGHGDLISASALSHDGTLVATGSEDRTLRLWNAKTGSVIAVLDGFDGPVRYVSFSPDDTGLLAISVSPDFWSNAAKLTLFGIDKEHNVRRSWVHDSSGTFATFSPDGEVVVAGRDNDSPVLLDTSTGRIVADFSRSNNLLTHAAFSPDGKKFATVIGGEPELWERSTGRLEAKLEGHEEEVVSVLFSADGSLLATTSHDGTARIWTTTSGEERVRLAGHEDFVYWAAFSPESSSIATVSGDQTVRIWDTSDGNLRYTLRGHDSGVDFVAYSPDGRTLVTRSWDSTVRYWETAPRDLIVISGHSDALTAVTFSPDGSKVLTASVDQTALLWDPSRGTQLRILDGHTDVVLDAAFSPNGHQVATSSADGTVRLWNLNIAIEPTVLHDHDGGVYSVAYSADSSMLVTTSDDGTGRLWNPVDGKMAVLLEGHDGAVWNASFSSDGGHVATVSADGTARIWDTVSGAQRASLATNGGMDSASLSPDGRLLLTSDSKYSTGVSETSEGFYVRVSDVDTGAELNAANHEFDVEFVDFAPDGSRFVSVSADEAEIWATLTFNNVANLQGHQSGIHAIAFSPDGYRLASGSYDGTVRLWDATTGTEIGIVDGYHFQQRGASSENSLAFSPDATRLVFTSSDGTARIWDISTLEKGDAFQVACQRLGNNTSLDDVRERYGLGELTPICGDNPPLPVDWRTLQ